MWKKKRSYCQRYTDEETARTCSLWNPATMWTGSPFHEGSYDSENYELDFHRLSFTPRTLSLSLSLSFYFQVSSLGRPTYTWLHQPIPTNQWLFKASQFLWRPIPLPTPNKAVSNILPQTLPTYGFHVPFIVSQKVVFFFFLASDFESLAKRWFTKLKSFPFIESMLPFPMIMSLSLCLFWVKTISMQNLDEKHQFFLLWLTLENWK